jgi:hypothetical protein
MNISPELKLKLINETNFIFENHQETFDFNYRGSVYKVPGISWNDICLDLSKDPKLYYECEIWYKELFNRESSDSSNKSYKINIGPFEGLWPTQCNSRTFVVNFLADAIHYGRKNWKDWFIQGDN